MKTMIQVEGRANHLRFGMERVIAGRMYGGVPVGAFPSPDAIIGVEGVLALEDIGAPMEGDGDDVFGVEGS